MKTCPHCGGAYPVDEGFCPMDGTRLRTLHATDGYAPVPSEAHHEYLGRVLDRRYRLDAVIGTGAMGVVFRATHTLIGRSFAVKVLRREHLESSDLAQRFLLEARVASSIKHPNVVDISDFGEIEGGAYYVMELLEGRSLANAIDTDGPMSPADAGLVGLQIANGLAAAHAMGVVHRDLKPDNVFLCAPRRGVAHSLVKLLDFGIARVGPRRITMAGSLLGTPEYISPEMAQGRDVDHRADLYALGVILFELLTATVPFYDREIARTLELHVRAPRPTLVSRRPDLASIPHVAELITSLLAVAPEDRPQSADIVARSLAAALALDLDREAAETLHRATVAIGSNLLQELADPSRPAAWPSPGEWPRQDAAKGPSPAPPAMDASPRVAVTLATPSPIVAPPSAARRAGLAAVGAAVLAGAATFGIARWVRPVDAAIVDPVDVGADAATADPPEHSAEVPPAAPSTDTRAVAELPVPVEAPPPIAVEPAVVPDVLDAAAPPSAAAPEPRPSAVAERSKSKRRKPEAADPVASDDPPTTPPPAPDPVTPENEPTREDPASSEPAKSPRDLKDPFPKKK